MASSSFNWETATELPNWDHILINSGTFTLNLLPYDPNIGERRIQPICNICPQNSKKRYLSLKAPNTYKITTNYISHLYYHHRATWEEMGFKTPPIGAKTTTTKSGTTTTSGPLDRLVSTRSRPLYPNSFTNKELARLTIEFIIANNLSFRTGISPTYKTLIQRLNPDMHPPTQHLLYQELETYYNELFQIFKHKLHLHITENKGSFTLCLDNWTSINQKSYLGITIHWIDPKTWKLQSYILRLQNLHKKHSGINLYTTLLDILTDFNIQNYIFCITRDNATNNDLLIDNFRDFNS
jgi:hypothetical protein